MGRRIVSAVTLARRLANAISQKRRSWIADASSAFYWSHSAAEALVT
jgi:hypothetical protein